MDCGKPRAASFPWETHQNIQDRVGRPIHAHQSSINPPTLIHQSEDDNFGQIEQSLEWLRQHQHQVRMFRYIRRLKFQILIYPRKIMHSNT